MSTSSSSEIRSGEASARGADCLRGAGGSPIPFSSLLAISAGGSGASTTDDPAGGSRFRLGRSPWLEGAAAARLPAPLVILADFAIGAAVAGVRSGAVLTEALRVDVLAPHSGELETTACGVAVAGRRHIANSVIRDRLTGAIVGSATGRLVVLDADRGMPRAPRPDRPGSVLSIREMLDGGLDVVRPAPSAVRVRIPVGRELGNSYGYMHGGAVAAMCDVGLHQLREDPGGDLFDNRVVDVSVDYYAPVPLASDIEVTAAVTGRAGSRVRVSASIGVGTDHPAAVACYTLRAGRRIPGGSH